MPRSSHAGKGVLPETTAPEKRSSPSRWADFDRGILAAFAKRAPRWAEADRLAASPSLPRARDAAFDIIFGVDALGRRVPSRLVWAGVVRHSCNHAASARSESLSGNALLGVDTIENDQALSRLLDEAIASERRTGAAIERLAGTLQELREWTAERIGAAPCPAGA